MYSRKEHIKKLVRIPLTTYRPNKENIQPVGMQLVKGKNIINKRQTDNLQSDNNRSNIKENLSNHTGHIEPNEKSIMDLLCNIMNRLEIIKKTKVNKFPHSREDLEGWLTEAYTWHKALEEKLTTKSERVKSAEIKGFVQRHMEII
ncbi:43514_t:CDS:2, partial [Gigaspora margarita]